MTTTLTASTTAQLNQDIATANAATSGGFIIDLRGNIPETTQLHAINLQSSVPLTIDGSNGSGGVHTLNGFGSNGFLVNAGSVTIENLRPANAVMKGGSSSAIVTLANDSFSRNVTIAHGLTIDEIAPVTFDSSTVTNQAGSTYDVGVIGSAFVAGVGVSRFINKGTLVQTSLADAGSVGVSNIYVNVTDTGTLSVEGGSNLRFFGAHNSFSGTYVGAGMFDYWAGSINALGTIAMTNGACTTVSAGTAGDDAIVNQNGVVTLSVNSTITNYGTWNFTSNNGFALADPSQPSSSGAAFTLYDALAKTGGSGTTVIACDFNPNGGAGTIKVATGTLAFNGLVSNFYGAISGAGTFSIGGGGADSINAGTAITTRGWTIAQSGTDVTLNVALSYSGFFKELPGATLTLTPSNDLTLNNSASFAGATVNGSGVLTLAGGHRVTMSGGTVGAGVTIDVLNKDTLKLSGTVTNSGTLIADNAGSTIVIAGVVSGGTIEINNGIVDITKSSSEDVIFTATGSGGLELAAAGSYTGTVSGFGGGSHTNSSQFIDLTAVKFNSNVHSSFSGGVLTITSGTKTVATINMSGSYVTSNFHLRAGSGGIGTIITDPSVTEPQSGNAAAVIGGGAVLEVNTSDSGKATFGGGGGALQPDQSGLLTGTVKRGGAKDGIDVPNIAFGAQTTLAHSQNSADTGGTRTVTDGRQAAAIALLGNYMAGSFVTAADGHGGTLVTETLQAHQPPPLSHPRA
jgi:hypothetical protein